MKHKKPRWTIKRIKNRIKHLIKKQYVATWPYCYGCRYFHDYSCEILDPIEGDCK